MRSPVIETSSRENERGGESEKTCVVNVCFTLIWCKRRQGHIKYASTLYKLIRTVHGNYYGYRRMQVRPRTHYTELCLYDVIFRLCVVALCEQPPENYLKMASNGNDVMDRFSTKLGNTDRTLNEETIACLRQK